MTVDVGGSIASLPRARLILRVICYNAPGVQLERRRRRHTQRRSFAFALTTLIALATRRPARSAPPPLPSAPRFQWSAPPSCPDERQVQGDIERLLGRSLSDYPSEIAASAAVTEGSDGRFTLRVVLDTPQGRRERKLEHPTACAPLAAAAAVVIGIALDPDVAARLDNGDLDNPGTSRPVPKAAEPKERAEPSETGSAAPTSGRTFRAGMRADGGASVGEFPQLGWRAGGALFLATRRFRVEGTFSYWLPQSQHLDAAPEAGVDYRLWAAGLRGCLRFGVATRTELLGCAGAELGQEMTSGTGLDAATSGADPWLALQFGPALSVRFTDHLGLLVALEGAVPLYRTRYAVENYGVAHRAAVLAPRILAGLEVEIP